MNWIWCILFCLGTIFMTLTQGGDAALGAMLGGAQTAVTLSISLGGAYMLWLGLLNVANKSNIIFFISSKLKGPCEWLFPGSREATAPITLNIAANMLGMGNAATPFGIEAMKKLQQDNPKKERATDAMCIFVAVNASALQVIPTTMIALRAAAGSAEPSAIIIPSVLSSGIATAFTIFAAKWLVKRI